MRVEELETALRDAAMREPPESPDVYPRVVRTARRRRTLHRAAGAGALVCVIAVALVGIVAVVRNDSPPSSVRIAQSPSKNFEPPSFPEGDRLVIPVTFLSGGQAEIVVPSALIKPNELTFVPGGAITWSGSPGLGRTLDISRGTVADMFAGQKPTAVYRDASGNAVPFYAEPSNNHLNYLAFQIGDWIVKVWDYPQGDPRGPAMTEDQRRSWAAHLGGHVTQQGFLVLDPVAPLATSVTDAPDAELTDGPNRMGVIFRGCSQPELQGPSNEHGYIISRGAPGAVLCNPNVPFILWIAGDQTFEQTANSLEIRNLKGPLPSIAR